jgi:hypothetical protein
VITSAALGRLLHRATVLHMRGTSFRLLDGRLAGSRQRSKPGQPKPEQREPWDAGEMQGIACPESSPWVTLSGVVSPRGVGQILARGGGSILGAS